MNVSESCGTTYKTFDFVVFIDQKNVFIFYQNDESTKEKYPYC